MARHKQLTRGPRGIEEVRQQHHHRTGVRRLAAADRLTIHTHARTGVSHFPRRPPSPVRPFLPLFVSAQGCFSDRSPLLPAVACRALRCFCCCCAATVCARPRCIHRRAATACWPFSLGALSRTARHSRSAFLFFYATPSARASSRSSPRRRHRVCTVPAALPARPAILTAEADRWSVGPRRRLSPPFTVEASYTVVDSGLSVLLKA